MPQLIFCPLAALMLRRSDARLVASIGFIFISVACLMVAYNLTPLWGSYQFLPSSLLQALGQSFALSGVVFFGILHLKPQDALTFGAVLQTSRLMGGEIGTRVRDHFGSSARSGGVELDRAACASRRSSSHRAGEAYGAATTKVIDPVGAVTRGELVLGNVVRAAATTQAVIDCFVVVGMLTAVALLVVVIRSAAPEGPASADAALSRARTESAMNRSRRVVAIGAVIVASLAACRVGPNYHAPVLPPGAEAPLVSLTVRPRRRYPRPMRGGASTMTRGSTRWCRRRFRRTATSRRPMRTSQRPGRYCRRYTPSAIPPPGRGRRRVRARCRDG